MWFLFVIELLTPLEEELLIDNFYELLMLFLN